MHLGNIECRL